MPLEFIDMSWNGDVVDRVWTFEGGSPSSSTFQNPTVTYNTPGTYKVTLEGNKCTRDHRKPQKTEFIEVQGSGCRVGQSISRDFSKSILGVYMEERNEWCLRMGKRLDKTGYDKSFECGVQRGRRIRQ